MEVIARLEAAGIEVRAERTGERVTVVLVDPSDLPRARRVLAPTPAPPTEEVEQPLMTERLRRIAPPIALVLAVLVAITLAYQGPLLGTIAVAAVIIGIAAWIRGRLRGRDDREYGPGADR